MSDPTAGRAGLDGWWREVGTAAVLGTGRRAAPPVPDLRPVGIGPRTSATSEEALLDAVAIGATLVRTGRRPPTVEAPAQAPDDEQPVAPARAVQLLELVLSQPPAGAAQRSSLLAHWLEAAAAVGCRVPHALVPRVLELATGSRELRPAAAVGVGARGRWLAGLRAEWSWAVAARGDDDRAGTGDVGPPAVTELEWARLPSAARPGLLVGLRRRDPDVARRLVLSSWGTDPARDRHAHLDAFRVGLGPDDEALLEQGLDDRAGAVRELAAELLDAQPTSARAERMAARLRPLVRSRGLLRRTVEIQLPDDPDPTGVRDGLGPPPPQRSARGWWLEQLCAAAPLAVWTELTGAAPADALRRIADPDARRGLVRAARSQRDAEWAAALLEHGGDVSLLAVVSGDVGERAVLRRVATTAPTADLGAAFASLDLPWSPAFSRALVGALRASKVANLQLTVTLRYLQVGLHPDAVADLEAWLAAAPEPTVTTHLRTLVQLHSVRRAIVEAFR